MAPSDRNAPILFPAAGNDVVVVDVLVRLCDLNVSPLPVVLRSRRAHGISVVACAFARAACYCLPISEDQGDGVLGMAGLRPVRRSDFSSLKFNFQNYLRIRLVISLI